MGDGIYLWPSGVMDWTNDEYVVKLRNRQILFELHCTPAGNLRLLARMRFYQGRTADEFEAVQKAARELGCPQPRPTRAGTATKSVALWQIKSSQEGGLFPKFGRGGNCSNDVAAAVWTFFADQPPTLRQFIEFLRVFIAKELAG